MIINIGPKIKFCMFEVIYYRNKTNLKILDNTREVIAINGPIYSLSLILETIQNNKKWK